MPKLHYVTPADDLQAVLDGAGEGDTIHLSGGTFRCKSVIRTAGLTLRGAGAEKTVLCWGDYARKDHPIGGEFNTFRTYTLAVCADGVTLEDLSIVNDAGAPEVLGQQVALSVVGRGFVLRRCVLRSTQDTLFLGPLPSDLIGRYEGFLDDGLRAGYRMDQRLEHCRIEGTVDFLFGSGAAVFDGCELRSLADRRGIGFVAAPSHDRCQAEGFTFRRCRFTCDDAVAAGSVYLARPWRDYGLCRFEDCEYGPHIAAQGFDPWSGTRRDLTARFFETPPVSGRVPWCNRG